MIDFKQSLKKLPNKTYFLYALFTALKNKKLTFVKVNFKKLNYWPTLAGDILSNKSYYLLISTSSEKIKNLFQKKFSIQFEIIFNQNLEQLSDDLILKFNEELYQSYCSYFSIFKNNIPIMFENEVVSELVKYSRQIAQSNLDPIRKMFWLKFKRDDVFRDYHRAFYTSVESFFTRDIPYLIRKNGSDILQNLDIYSKSRIERYTIEFDQENLDPSDPEEIESIDLIESDEIFDILFFDPESISQFLISGDIRTLKIIQENTEKENLIRKSIFEKNRLNFNALF